MLSATSECPAEAERSEAGVEADRVDEDAVVRGGGAGDDARRTECHLGGHHH